MIKSVKKTSDYKKKEWTWVNQANSQWKLYTLLDSINFLS